MGIAPQRAFTPVRSPRVRSIPKPVLSLTSLAAFEKCQKREQELRRRNRAIFAGGIAAIISALLAMPAGAIFIARHLNPPPPAPPMELLLAIDAALLLITFVIAVFTRKQSRADVANQFIQSGERSAGANDNPFARWILILILLGLLYGEFLVIDALKAMWMNHRLRNVDRHRAAVILAMLLQDPTGVDPRLLLQHGESPLHLRQIIAYLVINEWADVSRHGDRLTLVSPACRALREYSVHG
jgi:hypothetical protein